ncbi:MAG: hypothetical protein ABL958_14195, partial [Bdellovibrionia bacterium]
LGNYLPLSGGTLTGALILPAGTEALPSLAVGTTGTGLRSSGSELSVSVGGTERMRFESGAVGIGTSNPSETLDLESSGTVYLELARTATGSNGQIVGGIQFDGKDDAASNSAYGEIRQVAGSAAAGAERGTLHFMTKDAGTLAERMTIDGGKVGIGTLAPAELLEVHKDQSAVTAIAVKNTTPGSGVAALFRSTTDSGSATFEKMNTNYGGDVRIQSSTTSDLTYYANGGLIFAAKGAGNFGIGTANAGRPLHVVKDNATNGAVTDMLRVTHNTTGAPANGIGSGMSFGAESSTNLDRELGAINMSWTDVTDASRTADLSIKLTNNGVSEDKLKITGAGNVGIGTASPNNLIQVNGLINFDNAATSTFVGYQAGVSNHATGTNNTYLGYRAGYGITSWIADDNTAVGYNALYAADTGYRNTAVGSDTLKTNIDGDYNTAVGKEALALIEGSENTAVGDYAGAAMTTGSQNVLFGRTAGVNLTGGSQNIMIGYNTVAPNATGSNQLNIGNTIYGDTSTGRVGIGSTNPGEKLEVIGAIKIDNTAGGNAGCLRFDGTNLQFSHDCSSYSNLAGGGSDNLGNHTATQALDMATFGINGGIASGGDLTIDSTTHATKGDIILQPGGGNVGIGTTNPTNALDVRGWFGVNASGGTHLILDPIAGGVQTGRFASNFKYTDQDRRVVAGGSTVMYMDNTAGATAGDISFGSAPNGAADSPLSFAETLRIKQNGNVGIGTASPVSKLNVHDPADGAWKPVISLTDDDVAHGMTGVGNIDTKTYLHIGMLGTSQGGAELSGYSDSASNSGIFVKGTIGDTDPTDTTSAVALVGAKANGTFTQALGSNETVLQVRNATTNLMTFLGSGNVGIGNTNPGVRLDVKATGGGDGYNLRNASDVSIMDLTPNASGHARLRLRDSAGAVKINLEADASTPVYFNAGNNVGIGTVSPSDNLSVIGQVAVDDTDGGARGCFRYTGTQLEFANNCESGTPTWNAIGAGGGDNLGNHIATNILQMGGNGIYGSTSAGADLVLDSTTHATKGDIILNAVGGNVGVGTSSPGNLLTVYGGSAADLKALSVWNSSTTDAVSSATIVLGRGSQTHPMSYITSSNEQDANFANGYLSFSTRTSDVAPTEKMRITSSGNVGIGTASPSLPLEVWGRGNPDTGHVPVRIRHLDSTGGDFWEIGPNDENSFFINNQADVGLGLMITE